MSREVQIEAYFRDWNAYDAGQLALFAANGTYEDPMSRMGRCALRHRRGHDLDRRGVSGFSI
jgi:hypothetical protein